MLKRARGPRPHYFDHPEVDRLMAILMSVVAELSVTRERVDTLERRLAAEGAISRADMDAYLPDEAADQEREVLRQGLIQRILRDVILEPSLQVRRATANDPYCAVVREVSMPEPSGPGVQEQ